MFTRVNLGNSETAEPWTCSCEEGTFVNPFERGEIGPDLFRAACDMGLEGWHQGIGTGPIKVAGQSIGSSEKPGAPDDGLGDEVVRVIPKTKRPGVANKPGQFPLPGKSRKA
jgi:hypothetical protein